MYRFKKSLIALTGVLTLVAIVTVAVPHIGRGASGTNAPTTQTQNVKVVNTAGEPVPGIVQPAAGTVWNVGVVGTPNVAVSNFPATTTVGIDGSANTVKIDTTDPLPVRDVDNPGRHPIAASCTINNNQGFPCFVTTVPPGKRLVIEMVQLQLANVGFELTVVTNNTTITYQFFEPNQLVRVYADPLSTVQVAGGTAGTKAAISGYLVDLP
ncbi:MAG TPA: hypothetical protein VGP81_11245 [Pyrinomonadaceae bacterium]|jgi:hypothetical protein|nr:hypothetical protein [Pyrinomonadaceae bacterium]